MEKIEPMAEFFARRVEMYDEHMLTDVEGCKEGYTKMAELIPPECENLLDLGCGTGLELDFIFEKLPHLSVTGIDLSDEMLSALSKKHPDKNIELICDDYFKADLGEAEFDCAVSFQTMHHLGHGKKVGLYKKIHTALKEGGMYIECDYMVEAQAEEDFWFSENKRIRKEQGIGEDEFYHYDTPCTIENQIALLKKGGFTAVSKVFRMENTTMLVARK